MNFWRFLAINDEVGERKRDLEKLCRPPQKLSKDHAFGAGALFSGNNMLRKTMFLGSAFLAGAFVFWEKHDLKKKSGALGRRS